MWKGFAVFADRLVPRNFSSEIACAIGLAMQDYHSTANVFQRIKFSSATAKLFYLKQFAMYGIHNVSITLCNTLSFYYIAIHIN